jgi:hypothetical protein
MKLIYQEKELREKMIEMGWRHAQTFAPDKYAEKIMNIYKSVW